MSPDVFVIPKFLTDPSLTSHMSSFLVPNDTNNERSKPFGCRCELSQCSE
jgi:hypothetical protein